MMEEEEKVDEELQKKIEELQELKGVGETIARRLAEAGYDLQSIAVATSAELVEAAEISEGKAKQIIQEAKRKAKIGELVTAEQLLERRKKVGRITTGSSALDELLGGGVETRATTEFFGEYGTGKSQLAHQLCVNVQLPVERGGLEGTALVIDTEGTFRPERIVQMASALGLDTSKTLQNIGVYRVYTVEDQMLAAEKAEEEIDRRGVRLLVVDSLISLFRTEYLGRELLAPRQQKIARHVAYLNKLADVKDLAVVVTNQVMAKPDIFFGDPTRPAGGHIVAHGMTTRVYLRKSKGNARVARVVDSPMLPERDRPFCICEEGIRDLPA
ncbi:MAG: DNA repair and recombination protein RadA [Candidatus Hadarchaeales archaeon]